MTRMILRRLAISILILVAVSIVVFVATLLLPGDPARAILGQQATPERVAALNEQMGLDVPPVQRYFVWLAGVLTGDFGISIATNGPVSDLLGQTIINTLVLLVAAALIAIPAGIGIGIYSALHRGSKRETTITWFSLILAAMPEFVVGIALITLFATSVFRILPAVTMSPPGSQVWEYPAQLILPAATLILVVTPYIVRMTRATMIEAMGTGFVEMARLKGVPENQVVLRHALPHAIGPVAQVIAIQLAWMVGGVVVVEYLFRYPGVGQALIDAVSNRDVQVVQAISLLVAVVYVIVNLLADIVGILADPRLRSAK